MSRQSIDRASETLDFGKHAGKTIEWIIENNPSYILWLDENGIVEFPTSILDKAFIEDANNFPPEDFFWQPD